ncbi:hypothetical protein GCM10010211_70930 [Streptomyces albospinus]|uniref:Uncharacterized protein n=2 Tax=Streptomyces albospinus TaxID=285515 RepID=A0ABQ2VKI0_9ACTN|nr:hypothetical protein GCM10010211_70930 [Streptomyces albospinus]
MRLLHRAFAPAVAAPAALLMFTACSVGPERAHGGDATAPKKRLGGVGDLLVGAVLTFSGGEVDNQKFEPPPSTDETWPSRHRVEFHDDGRVSGTYGYSPFELEANVRASDLTLREQGPAATTEGCPRSVAAFERQSPSLPRS